MTSPGLRVVPRTLPSVSRVVGRVEGARPGPTLLAVGGLHGNEPAGILAVRQVLERLRGRADHLRGSFVSLAGNLGALARGRRFVERDLNRIWTRRRMRSLERHPDGSERMAEDREQVELLRLLDEIIAGSHGGIYAMDLHTTSSVSGAWITVEDTLANRRFARAFPVPAIMGLEERVEGTLMAHLVRAGHVGMGFEGGQHEDPRSVDRIRAAIWIGLEAAGILSSRDAPEIPGARLLLERDASSMPQVLEVRHRHGIRPTDGFRMKPGYVNLQPIREGEILAHDGHGEIRSPEPGRLLMPLYQQQGQDGFFVVREIRQAWLRVSEALRNLGLGRVVRWLPGVTDQDPYTIRVDPHVARWYPVEILHLLGYRRAAPRAGTPSPSGSGARGPGDEDLVFVRQRER